MCQFEDAFTQLSGATPIGAGIDARFTYVDLGSVLVRGEYTPDGEERRTGRPMFGAGAMAGTDEGLASMAFAKGETRSGTDYPAPCTGWQGRRQRHRPPKAL